MAGEDGESASGPAEVFLDGLSSENPCGARLSLDEQGRLSWPVLFLYPEYAQSDFISAFHEDSRCVFTQHPATQLCVPPANVSEETGWLLPEEQRERSRGCPLGR